MATRCRVLHGRHPPWQRPATTKMSGTRITLARLLRHHGGSTDVATLFKDANLSVTDFYKQLAWEIEQGYIHDDASKLEAR